MSQCDFGKFSSSFGLVNAQCQVVTESFLAWQNEVLFDYGYQIEVSARPVSLQAALAALMPKTSPIVTRYLFWPLNESWTLYFDNGRNGTDASPPQILSQRLSVDSIRVVMAEHIVHPLTRRVDQYGANLFDYYSKGVPRRIIGAANDGGKWVFYQTGEPFPFELVEMYKAARTRDRFTSSMLKGYLKELGITTDDDRENANRCQVGNLLQKKGKMPKTYMEYSE